MVALAKEGIDRLEEPRQRSMETSDVLRTYLKEYRVQAEEFLRRAGTDVESLQRALDENDSFESQPDPPRLRENATAEGRALYELRKRDDDDRRAKGEAAPFSAPLKKALGDAREGLPEGSQEFGVGAYIAALLTGKSNAQAAFQRVADPEQTTEALAWLRSQADPAERANPFGDIQANQRELLDAIWPSVLAKMESTRSDRSRAVRDEHYESNRAAYEEPLDIAERLAKHPVKPEDDYTWRSGALLHAAANEARIRRAPEATLDHLLVALLRDGTDTAAFLDARGVDRREWARRLDQALPRFGEGPRWPPNARDLNMSTPGNRSYRFKPLPEGREVKDLSKEERKEYIERTVDLDLRFTDLRFLAQVPDEPKTMAHGLFAEANISEDALKTEIAALERGDRNWWRKRPDLAAQLRNAEPSFGLDEYKKASLCVEAAQYEARMRHAPVTEFDDLLVALLVPGTDFWELAESRGIDPAALREEIDAQRLRYESGPTFPEAVDELNFVGHLTKKGFSDLLFLSSRFGDRQNSRRLEIVRKRGLTPSVIAARLEELGIDLLWPTR